ncbi:glycosyl hydrolase family 8 [Citreimonas salinaria]|uniref:cellulase n=1 Tax=Citreimonas salinaria TaxID=321339 RepID=A0A1H3MRQ7_9RHOB|nr:glycosyl hydrolase family 8 [Citreimonas salinaria]SDY78779.1 endoglucanase [Citreimonas salinaria]
MNRRAFLKQSALLALLASGHGASAAGPDAELDPLIPAWEAWKAAHLQQTGRVIDARQDQASHSEGQGYGIRLAVAFRDRAAFDAMDRWTQANLAVRPDTLLAWRWRPDLPERIDDFNNASDGDLFYAWSLALAAERWSAPDYLARATAMANDLAASCVVARPDRPGDRVLLPAAFGFVKDDAAVLNVSYMMPRALAELGRASGQGALEAAAEGALRLMSDLAQTGSMPDWVRASPEGLGPAEGFASHTGYEAMRVPLFLCWSGQTAHPAVATHAALPDDGGDIDATPVVFDRTSGDVLQHSGEAGYRALQALTRCAAGNMGFSTMPPFDPEQTYYPATLHLFAMLCARQTLRSCTPI